MPIRGLLAVVFLSLSALACDIKNIEGCDEDKKREDDQICRSFCDHLVQCDSVAPSQYGACVSQCQGQLGQDEDRTREGCQCVLDDACRAVSDYSCPGAPLPSSGGSGEGGSSQGGAGTSGAGSTAGSTSSGGASPAGGASSAGSGGATSNPGYACTINHDCANGEDCLDGTCRARCKASCQCHTGEVCDAGYCVPPVDPPVACASDCDCAAGHACVSGACE